IRDFHVTGVQTCALPICFLDFLAIPGGTRAFRIALVHMSLNLAVTAAFALGFVLRAEPEAPVPPGLIVLSGLGLVALTVAGYLRSEERRVGEGCRGQGWE